MTADVRIAVLIPCHNEALTVAKVVADFRAALPQAVIYVFDNASSDDTAALARAAGARVIPVPAKGKGNVVRSMFRDVDADVLLMVDGDDTYPADHAERLLAPVLAGSADMVVGTRLEAHADSAFRRFHGFGNRLVRTVISQLFGTRIADVLSGYRAFNRRFVRSMPVLSQGFEIETEISVHALELRMPVGELVTKYGARPEGSASKLATYRDGWRILKTIATLYRVERPVLFYGGLAALLIAVAIVLVVPLLITYLDTGLVPRFPTAILATGMVIVAVLSFFAGLILDTVTRGRREIRRLAYLAYPAPFVAEK